MRGFLCLAFTILLVLGMFWVSPYRAMNQAETVETVGCEQADIFNAVTMSGKTESASETKVYAPSAAWVEKLYVSQGTDENRSIEETLDLGWELLSILPRSELKRIKPEYIDKYLPKKEG